MALEGLRKIANQENLNGNALTAYELCASKFHEDDCPSAYLTNLPACPVIKSLETPTEDEQRLSLYLVDSHGGKTTIADYHAGRRADDLRSMMRHADLLVKNEVTLMLDFSASEVIPSDCPAHLTEFVSIVIRCATGFTETGNILACVIAHRPTTASDSSSVVADKCYRLYFADYGQDFERNNVFIYMDVCTSGRGAKKSLRQFCACLAAMKTAGVHILFDFDFEPGVAPLKPGALGTIAGQSNYSGEWTKRLPFRQRLWMTALSNIKNRAEEAAERSAV